MCSAPQNKRWPLLAWWIVVCFFAVGSCTPGPSKQEVPAAERVGGIDSTGPDAGTPAERQSEASPDTSSLEGWVSPATPYQGKATWYEADGSGNCSFPKVSGPPMVAALNESQYGDADFCGACARVTGPDGTIIVRIVDRCPECEANHLDLSKEAFSRLADLSVGVIQISWQLVPCDDNAPIQFFYKDGSSQWWTAIQVRRHRVPITKLEAFKGGRWVALKRERYNFFVDSGGLGDQPVRLRVHGLHGEVLEETIPAPSSSTLHTGTTQF